MIGTRNLGKWREYQQMLANLRLRLFSPDQIGLELEVSEVGTTFCENALAKARAYARASSLWSLADDSGLEVDALGGEPGVRSARFAGPTASDQDNIALLLARLRTVPFPQRTARFFCAVALAPPSGGSWLAHGSCQGLILTAPRGTGGFGYDPLFYVPSLGKTFAELPPRAKNNISHRIVAVRHLRALLPYILTHNRTAVQSHVHTT